MQALVDTGIHKFKDNCFHQAVECCSSLSIESSSDGGGTGEVEANAGIPRWAVMLPRQNMATAYIVHN